MTLVLNGTTGVSAVDGSAATPAIQGNDTNTGVFFPAADAVAIATGGAEAVRVNGSGNVGIGVTPSSWDGTVFKAIDIGGVYKNSFYGQANGDWTAGIGTNHYYNAGWKYASNGAASRYEIKSNQHAWFTAPSGTAGNAISFTQAMTLDSSGNLLVGTTSVAGSAKVTVSFAGGSAASRGLVMVSGSTANTAMLGFQNPNGYAQGEILTSGTSTSYTTSSDYRLKENVQPMAGALAVVSQLKPVTYKWKVDGSDGQGFIAHELQEVVPDCVTGAKDAVDAEGSPVYQGIDTSFLVATLTAALQETHALIKEQQAKIESLTVRITALEKA